MAFDALAFERRLASALPVAPSSTYAPLRPIEFDAGSFERRLAEAIGKKAGKNSGWTASVVRDPGTRLVSSVLMLSDDGGNGVVLEPTYDDGLLDGARITLVEGTST